MHRRFLLTWLPFISSQCVVFPLSFLCIPCERLIFFKHHILLHWDYDQQKCRSSVSSAKRYQDRKYALERIENVITLHVAYYPPSPHPPHLFLTSYWGGLSIKSLRVWVGNSRYRARWDEWQSGWEQVNMSSWTCFIRRDFKTLKVRKNAR